MGFQTFDERIAINLVAQLANSDGTTSRSIWTADAQVRRLDAIFISSTDTVDRYVQFNLNIGAADQALWEVLIPAGAGHGVVPSVEVFETLNKVNLAGMVVGPGNIVRWNAVVTLTSAKILQLIALGGIF